jgi:radical SAM protein with 4Fe4S-binding SPASM domain
MPLTKFPLWESPKRIPFAFELEITARCNNRCRHCCINLPAGDRRAKEQELSFEVIKDIIDQAVSMGAVWALLTGGEPLLREDFSSLYLHMKKKGLLVSVFTNATLIGEEHIRLFQKYPPRDMEVTVYGVTRETYERVTRTEGSYAAFSKGLSLFLQNRIKVRLKAMALRSNLHEMPEIASFCREKTKDYFRLDPFLHLRYDRKTLRNEEIRAERLSPKEIAALEQADPERFEALQQTCGTWVGTDSSAAPCSHVFHCGAGNGSFSVSYDGLFRLCPSLWHSDCVYDLKRGNLQDAWQTFIPQVRKLRSERKEFLNNCRSCTIANFCMMCPGHADLETGATDQPVEYFCRVAHARAETFGKKIGR